MKKFKFKKLDAFAAVKSAGNPAGMVYLDTNDIITVKSYLKIDLWFSEYP